jgi:hypothetical protein
MAVSIHQILKNIKSDFDTAITTAQFNDNEYANGNKAKEALIRSQRIINYIHEFIKSEFLRCGVPAHMIYPPIGKPSPEITIKGFLKSKNQDVSIIPTKKLVTLTETGAPELEKVLTVNIRSQLSSLGKNIDTLYERTFAEALNLHLSYPKQCLGEVYLIPTHEYDDKAMVQNKIVFKSPSKVENYIRMFQAINNRRSDSGNEYKYERVCLLIADFRQKNPKLYNSLEELKNDGLISKSTKASLDYLTTDHFAENLLDVYVGRFGRGVII